LGGFAAYSIAKRPKTGFAFSSAKAGSRINPQRRIQLNARVSLRGHMDELSFVHRTSPNVRYSPGKAVRRSYSAWRLCSIKRQSQWLFQMASSNTRGSKLRRPKPRTSPSDLADRFFELQQLRKKVQKLEKLANSRQGGGGTGIVGRDK